MKIAMVVWLALVPGALAYAQEQADPPRTFYQRLDAVDDWLTEYRAWERWFEQWGNRIAHNFDDQVIWERKERPQPPAWLEADCRGYVGADEPLVSACYILQHWDEHPMLILQRRHAWLTPGARANEKVAKSSFFHRIHLSGMWVQAQYPAATAYGVVGMQIGVLEIGRFTLPAIGVMLVMVPDGEGGREWKPTTTVGVAYRICDFVAPWINRRASLHLNVARTNVHSPQADQIHPGMVDVNLAGLSVSIKRR